MYYPKLFLFQYLYSGLYSFYTDASFNSYYRHTFHLSSTPEEKGGIWDLRPESHCVTVNIKYCLLASLITNFCILILTPKPTAICSQVDKTYLKKIVLTRCERLGLSLQYLTSDLIKTQLSTTSVKYDAINVS